MYLCHWFVQNYQVMFFLQLEILKGMAVKWTIAKLRDLLRQYVVPKEKSEKNKCNEMNQ